MFETLKINKNKQTLISLLFTILKRIAMLVFDHSNWEIQLSEVFLIVYLVTLLPNISSNII